MLLFSLWGIWKAEASFDCSHPYENAPNKGKQGKGRPFSSPSCFESWPSKGKPLPKGKENAGKGKGYGAGKSEWLPEGLRYQGASAWNQKGNKVCYGFNLGGCNDANCQRGDHGCVIYKCGGDHPVTKCPLKPKKLVILALMRLRWPMVPQDEPVRGVISAPAQEVDRQALPSGAGLDPASEDRVTGGIDFGFEFPPLMASALSATTLPFFQTGDEASSRDAQCSSAAAPQRVFSDASHGGPARAILQCFAGQARVASALITQGYFAYGVDRVKHKSAMAPVLQMDLSSRTSCDSILTWLDKQKIAGVLICIPKHAISAAFVFAVINGCLDRDLPLVVEGSCKSPFWTNMSQLPDAQQAPHWIEVEWGCWIPTSQQRSFVMSNLPEITTVRREGREPAGKSTVPEVSSAG